MQRMELKLWNGLKAACGRASLAPWLTIPSQLAWRSQVFLCQYFMLLRQHQRWT